MKNHSKSSIPNLLGLPKKVENQATDFWRNMRGDTLEPSTYFCWNCKQDFEIKHLLLFGMQTERGKKKKTTRRSSKALTSVGYAKEHLKTKHLLSVGYAKTTPHFENPALDFCWVCQKKTVENQALTSSVGYGRNT